MTNANNPHAATDATLRQIFKTMDAHQAQEIREAYYKAIEGLMTLAETLEVADAQQTPSGGRSHQRGPSPGRDEEQPPRKDPLNHRPAECHGRRERSAAFFRLVDTRPQSRSSPPSDQVPNIKTSQHGPTSGPVRLPEKHGRTSEIAAGTGLLCLEPHGSCVSSPSDQRFHHAKRDQTDVELTPDPCY